MSKRLEFLWEPWVLPVSVQVRTVGRHNQELASCATGEIAQFSSFSTDVEDQEKQRNSTDKNRTVSTCSDTLFQRRSSQCWRGESLILECLLVYSTLKSKYKRNLINSLYTAITWQMFVLWFHMTALTEITCHSGKKVRAHFSFPFIFSTPPAFLWCLSLRSRGRN